MPVAKRILVTTDFSEAANGAICYAFELAEKLGAEVVLCNIVLKESHRSSYFIDLHPAQSGHGLEEAAVRAEQKLRDAVPEEFRNKVPHSFKAEPAATEHEGIRDAIAETGADLLVMASCGAGGVKALFLGSVANKVLSAAPCPVLVLKAEACRL